jgi:hypothetical protein
VGHERLNILPRSKIWRLIVEEMAGYAEGNFTASSIAKNTLFNVHRQFGRLEDDPSIKASFEFLIKLSHAFQKPDPIKYLNENKILDKEELSLIKLGKAVTTYKSEEVRSKEYQAFARQAAIDAINKWYAANVERGLGLFSEDVDREQYSAKFQTGEDSVSLPGYTFQNSPNDI